MAISRIRLDDLTERLAGDIELFICSASFERRCQSIADKLAPGMVKNVLIAENQNHLHLHGKNPAQLKRRFPGKYSMVMLDTTDPMKTASNLRTSLDNFPDVSGKRILIDITTFTHEALLILLTLIKFKFKRAQIECVYIGAGEYSLGDAEKDKWLSKGVGEVRSVLGFPGEFLPSRKLHLIILVGFEDDRATELIRRYEPSMISLGYGETSELEAKNHSSINRNRFQMVKAIYGSANEFTFLCYDPEKTKSCIERQAGLRKDMNVIVAAMNTKLSSVGAALAAFDNEAIQLCYAQAHSYNYEHYSSPGEHVYLYDLHF